MAACFPSLEGWRARNYKRASMAELTTFTLKIGRRVLRLQGCSSEYREKKLY